MKIHVVVTATDIDRGLPDNPDSCPIARALRRSGYPYAQVRPKTTESPYCVLPAAAQEFIKAFDGGGFDTVEPFEFDMTCKDDNV